MDLKPRYDVSYIREDDWHSYSGSRTNEFIKRKISSLNVVPRRILNAGAGCYQLNFPSWEVVSLDLFKAPLFKTERSVCASVEAIPFGPDAFGCVICVGEVLAYCDPARAISEFGRVLAPSGLLICDFGNSRSIRYRFTSSFGRAADLIIDCYNGTPEKVWVYSPAYLREVLASHNFVVTDEEGTHIWSAFARRFGIAISSAVKMEKSLRWLRLPADWSNLMTIAAVKRIASKL